MKVVRGLLIFGAAVGAFGVAENRSNELARNPWVGLLVGCACLALIVTLFYIQPRDET